MPEPGIDIIAVLRKAIFLQTDLGSVAETVKKTGTVKGSLIAYCQDGPEGIAIVPMEYELDLETGEVTFSQAA